MAIFFRFSTTSNHFHPLQVENCNSNSRLVVGEDDNGKFRLERVKYPSWTESLLRGCNSGITEVTALSLWGRRGGGRWTRDCILLRPIKEFTDLSVSDTVRLR